MTIEETKLEEKVEVDYSKLGKSRIEKPPATMLRDIKARPEKADFFDYLAERAMKVFIQLWEFSWPLILLGFFSTITLVGILIFAEGLAVVPINIVLAWVYLFMGGTIAILCGFCSAALLVVELTRFYYAFAYYIRKLKVQIRR